MTEEEKLEEMAKEFKEAKEAYFNVRVEEHKALKSFLKDNINKLNFTVKDHWRSGYGSKTYTSGGRITPYDLSNWKWVCIEQENKIDITISLNMPERNGEGDWVTHFDRVGIIISQGDLNKDQAIENLGRKIHINNDSIEYKYVKSTDSGYKSEIMTTFTLPLSQKDRAIILKIIELELSELYPETEFDNIEYANDIDENIKFLIKRNHYNNARLVELKKLEKYLGEKSNNDNKLSICSKIDDKNDWMELEILDELNSNRVIISFNSWEQDKEELNWHALYDRIGIAITKGQYTKQYGLRNEGTYDNENLGENINFLYNIETDDGKNSKLEIMTGLELPLTKDDMKAIVNIINTKVEWFK